MNKTTKGVVAAGAAAVLLTGGVGSLAYWTTQGTASGGSITAGTMSLTNGTCDTNWVYATGAAKAGQTVNLFVPGDKVQKSCTFTVTATGDNLSATIDAPGTLGSTFAPTGTSASINTAATYVIAKSPSTRAIANGGTVTSADNGATVTATFVSTVPFGTDETAGTKVNANDTKSIVATLNQLTVKLTQGNPNP